MTPEALRAELAKGRVRRAYLLAGSQALLRDEALSALRAVVLGASREMPVTAEFSFEPTGEGVSR